ncbi:MAG: GLUG motif-containing protein [Desulfitobacteriaceae bacterium]|nr:GLUG motif-containing protein [Desulfitobacteriaceae bacterium]MDD4402061.1 GLUG motif-containing protein [Desulfitobacteriaceae bacterium]
MGGIVGYLSNGVVDNCHTEGMISVTSSWEDIAFACSYGGLVGDVRDSGRITNSSSDVNITGYSTGDVPQC